MLIQDIRTVRFKAISRRRPAYLCALKKEGKCSQKAYWNEGWFGFVDNNLNGSYDSGDKKVLHRAKAHRETDIAIIFHARLKNIKFDARGVLRRSGHFRVCLNPGNSSRKLMKVIRMNAYGRLAVEEDMLACD